MSDTPTDPIPERNRIEPPSTRRLDALPILYLVGFLILAGALAYLWRHPATPHAVQQEVARVDTIRQELDQARQANAALADRVAALEAKPAPTPENLAPLTARIDALERRSAPDLAPIVARLDALEKRPSADLGPLQAKVAALEAKPPIDLGPVQSQAAAAEAQGKQNAAALASINERASRFVQQLQSRLETMEAQQKQTAAGLQSISQRAGQMGRLQAAATSLAAGQKLGEIPGAPPALARFAHDAPPTEAGLRLSFDQAAEAAHRASQPAITDNQPFLDRMWTRAQQSLTIRQGDHILVGDPIGGVIQHAREQLDAGDLAGAVKTLDQLGGPARAAMTDWLGRAQALLDAREAIAGMANG